MPFSHAWPYCPANFCRVRHDPENDTLPLDESEVWDGIGLRVIYVGYREQCEDRMALLGRYRRHCRIRRRVQ